MIICVGYFPKGWWVGTAFPSGVQGIGEWDGESSSRCLPPWMKFLISWLERLTYFSGKQT